MKVTIHNYLPARDSGCKDSLSKEDEEVSLKFLRTTSAGTLLRTYKNYYGKEYQPKDLPSKSELIGLIMKRVRSYGELYGKSE